MTAGGEKVQGCQGEQKKRSLTKRLLLERSLQTTRTRTKKHQEKDCPEVRKGRSAFDPVAFGDRRMDAQDLGGGDERASRSKDPMLKREGMESTSKEGGETTAGQKRRLTKPTAYPLGHDQQDGNFLSPSSVALAQSWEKPLALFPF